MEGRKKRGRVGENSDEISMSRNRNRSRNRNHFKIVVELGKRWVSEKHSSYIHLCFCWNRKSRKSFFVELLFLDTIIILTSVFLWSLFPGDDGIMAGIAKLVNSVTLGTRQYLASGEALEHPPITPFLPGRWGVLGAQGSCLPGILLLIFRPSSGYLEPWDFLFNRPKYWLQDLLEPLPFNLSLGQTVVASMHTLWL